MAVPSAGLIVPVYLLREGQIDISFSRSLLFTARGI